MVAWQCERGNVADALAAIERGRARSLLDEMSTSGADLDAGRSNAEREEMRREEAELTARIAQAEARDDAAALAEAKADLYEHYRQRRGTSAVYRNLLASGGGPPRIRQLQRSLLADGGLLLVYLLGAKDGYVVVIRGDSARIDKLALAADEAAVLGAEPGPLTAERLQPVFVGVDSSGLLQDLSSPDSADRATARLAALWKTLIPATEREALVAGEVKRLIIVPDGPLALLPFETLVVGVEKQPQYLLDVSPPIEYAPSATVLFNLASKQSPAADETASLLTLGGAVYRGINSPDSAEPPPHSIATRGRRFEPLPYSNWETTWVADGFRGEGGKVLQLTEGGATEAAVRAAAAGQRVLHLACHGLVDQTFDNFFGALALTPGPEPATNPADDGFLTLPEIYQLDLRGCELAILSACQTNYGPQQQGEGTWALSRGFLVAGARRVVASNWLVDDEAAASLVSVFTGRVAKDAKAGAVDYAAALQTAQRWVRKQEKWQSPYYWGTFVLVGPR
jgi:CHAT domain-containing protein